MSKIYQPCDFTPASFKQCDHSLVFCAMKGGVPKLPSKTLGYQSFRNYDNDVFVTDFGQVPWSVISGMENDAVFLWERSTLFSDIGLSDLEYHKIFYSENLNPCLRTLQGFITVLWVKLGEEYNGKGSEDRTH